jgi:hypothetical protein
MPLIDGIFDLCTQCLIAVILDNDTMPTALKRCMMFNKMSVAAICDALSNVHSAKKLSPDSNVVYTDLLDAIMK